MREELNKHEKAIIGDVPRFRHDIHTYTNSGIRGIGTCSHC